jgi:hypothetical protein
MKAGGLTPAAFVISPPLQAAASLRLQIILPPQTNDYYVMPTQQCGDRSKALTQHRGGKTMACDASAGKPK